MNTRFFLIIILSTFCADSLLRLLCHALGWKRTMLNWISGFLHLAPIIPCGMLIVHILEQNQQPIVWIAGNWLRSSEVSIPIIFQLTHTRLLMIGALFLLHAFDSLSGIFIRDDLPHAILRNVSIVSGTLIIVSGSLIQITVLSFITSLFMVFLAARIKPDNDAASPGSSIWFALALSDILLMTGAIFTSRICGTTDFQVLFRVIAIHVNQTGGTIIFWALLPLFAGLLIRSLMFCMYSFPFHGNAPDTRIVVSVLHCLSLPSLACLIDLQTNLFNTHLFKSILESLSAVLMAAILLQFIRLRSRFALGQACICLLECTVLLMFFWGFPGGALPLFLIITLSVSILLFHDVRRSPDPEQCSGWIRQESRFVRIGISLSMLLIIQPAMVTAIERRSWWTAGSIAAVQLIAVIGWSVVTARGSIPGIGVSGEDASTGEGIRAGVIRYSQWMAFLVAIAAVMDLVGGLNAWVVKSDDPRALFFGSFTWTPLGSGIALSMIVALSGIHVWAKQFTARRHHGIEEDSISSSVDFEPNRVVSLLDAVVFSPVIRIGRIFWEIDRIMFLLIPESTVLLIAKGCSILGEFDRFGRRAIESRGLPGLIDRCTRLLEFISGERNIRYMLIIGLLSGLMVLAGFILLTEGF